MKSLYKKTSSQDEIDPEVFERVVVMTRAVAVTRPENLVKFVNELTENLDSAGVPFPVKIVSTFWRFYQTQPSNSSLVTAAHSGIHYTEMIIFALVEILHAFIVTDSSYVSMITELYVQLLLCLVSASLVNELSSRNKVKVYLCSNTGPIAGFESPDTFSAW